MPLLDPVRCPQCLSAINLRPVYRASDVAWLGSPKLPVGVHCQTCRIPLRVLWPGAWFATAPTLMGFAFVIALFVGGSLAVGGALRPEPALVLALAAACLAALLRAPIGARLARLRFLEPNESVAFVLERALPPEATREEIRDLHVLAQQRPPEPDGARAATGPGAPRDREPESAADADPGLARTPTLATDPDDNPQANEAQTDEPADPPLPADDARDPGGGATDDLPGWECPNCHEDNPGTFGLCWKCNSLRPSPEQAAAPGSAAVDADPERRA